MNQNFIFLMIPMSDEVEDISLPVRRETPILSTT